MHLVLNAVIRAVVKTATCEHGMRVIGIEDGFEGLLGATQTRLLSPGDVRGLLPRGRNDPGHTKSRQLC
jgi:6-phosphofructokinase 1